MQILHKKILQGKNYLKNFKKLKLLKQLKQTTDIIRMNEISKKQQLKNIYKKI